MSSSRMNKTQLLFLIILIEGYVVLATELLAIRQLIPFVGSGTETISIVISAVLLPLAIGYHFGGSSFQRRHAKAKKEGRTPPSVRKILLRNIVSAVIVLSLGLSYPFLEIFFGLTDAAGLKNRLAQTALYSGLFLVMPVFLLGQTVPLVSNYFSRKKLSQITGLMLFFSTAGSFLGSVFSTIVLMMTIGVHNTVTLTLSLLLILMVLLNRRIFVYENLLGLLVFGLVLLLNSDATMRHFLVVSNNAYNLVSVSNLPKEGIKLFSINRSASSAWTEDPDKQFTYLKYLEENFIAPLAHSDPPRHILILGAGGFTIGYHDTHNRYVYVDIDPALKDAAEKHFLPGPLSPNKTFTVASARAFVRGTPGRYDLIVIDTFTNVTSIPMETTTREFLVDVKKLLKPGGIVAANIISSPDFNDAFSIRYDNTFASVFPSFTRQIATPYDPWQAALTGKKAMDTNNLYIYFDRPGVEDGTVYTDDRNTYSIDR